MLLRTWIKSAKLIKERNHDNRTHTERLVFFFYRWAERPSPFVGVARLGKARICIVVEVVSTGPAPTESNSSQCTYTNAPSAVPCQPARVGEDGARPPSRARQRVARRCQTCTAHPLGGCEPASWPCAEPSPAGKDTQVIRGTRSRAPRRLGDDVTHDDGQIDSMMMFGSTELQGTRHALPSA